MSRSGGAVSRPLRPSIHGWRSSHDEHTSANDSVITPRNRPLTRNAGIPMAADTRPPTTMAATSPTTNSPVASVTLMATAAATPPMANWPSDNWPASPEMTVTDTPIRATARTWEPVAATELDMKNGSTTATARTTPAATLVRFRMSHTRRYAAGRRTEADSRWPHGSGSSRPPREVSSSEMTTAAKMTTSA